MKASILFATASITLALVIPARAANLLPPLDNASTESDSDAAWQSQTWSGNGRFAVVDAGRDGGKCLRIESRRGGDLGWTHQLPIEPGSLYRLSGWIKTENVEPTTGRGVVLEVSGGKSTPPLTGTNDWTRVEVLIRPGDARELQINGTFGSKGLASGRAWFDDIQLEPIDLENFRTEVTIDATEPKDPISPYIYAQFIEHLGRCIYGGIWAEMLEDRKFYFPITDKYDPYRSLRNSKFPVVGASPWEVIGPAGSVTMIKENALVGEQTPQIAAGSGIRQNDLGFVAGKDYLGYVWLRVPDEATKVNIKFGSKESEAVLGVGPLTTPGKEFIKIPFEFTAVTTTDKGQLTFEVEGAPVQIGTVSLMPADNVDGFRADTLALLKQLNAPLYRWPGGNFVSGYNWRDGIGDRDRRPPRGNPAWTGVEHNDVGLDEFVNFCRLVGAEPMVAANTGFGDDYSAAQEVEYTNAGPDTIGGSWRVKNGHAQPYNVKYWCVGNEMFGNWQLGFMALGQYVQKHNRASTAMKKVDPNLVLVGSGDLGTQATLGGGRDPRRVSWSEGMLESCARNMNLISEHFYVWDRSDDIPTHVAAIVNNIRSKAEGHRRLQKVAPPSGRVTSSPSPSGRGPGEGSSADAHLLIPIAMDEWNYWFRNYEYGELGCPYQLRDALGIAAGLHEYFRNSDIIHMAHYAQTVNVIGCVKTTKTDAFFDPTALPLLLYRREFGTRPLVVRGNQDVLALDVAAARTEDGSAVTIGVVNPNPEPQKLNLKLNGLALADTAKVWRIAGNDPTATNTAEKQSVKIAEEATIPFGNELEVPAYSINLYRVTAK